MFLPPFFSLSPVILRVLVTAVVLSVVSSVLEVSSTLARYLPFSALPPGTLVIP